MATVNLSLSTAEIHMMGSSVRHYSQWLLDQTEDERKLFAQLSEKLRTTLIKADFFDSEEAWKKCRGEGL